MRASEKGEVEMNFRDKDTDWVVNWQPYKHGIFCTAERNLRASQEVSPGPREKMTKMNQILK
jgi:hypothetical protein